MLGLDLPVGLCPLELLTPDPSREPSFSEGRVAAGRGHGRPRPCGSGTCGLVGPKGAPGLRWISSDAILSGCDEKFRDVAESPSSAAIIPADSELVSDAIARERHELTGLGLSLPTGVL